VRLAGRDVAQVYRPPTRARGVDHLAVITIKVHVVRKTGVHRRG